MNRNVVVVAPFFGASMGHALRCFAALEGVQLGVISQQAEAHVPPDLRARLAGHMRVHDALDADQLVGALRAFRSQWGRVDRLEGYLEPLQVPLGAARDALGIDGLGLEEARAFRDKTRMKEVLRAAGVPVARQARVASLADASRFVGEVGYPIVLKPVDGSGARDTVRVTDDRALMAALNRMVPAPGRPLQAEEFVTGAEHTFETVVLEGVPVWSSSCAYLPGPLAVLENPWMQYCMLLPREPDLPHVEAFRDTNRRALAALGLRNGLAHLEWFLRADGTHLVSEVGARPPGANIVRMTGEAHDMDLWARWARLVVHRTWDPAPRRWATGCAFLRGQGHGHIVRGVRGWDAVATRLGETIVAARLPQPGQPHSTHYEGDGWVIVRHPQTEGVVAALRDLVTEVRVELSAGG